MEEEERGGWQMHQTTVTILYVKGVSEALSRVFWCHGASMTMKPHMTPKRMLVHPKDKRTPQENAGVVHQVPCKYCPCVYTGETERRYGVREKEHQSDVRGGKVHTGKKGLSHGIASFSHNRSCHQEQPHHRLGGSEIHQ